MNSPERYVTLKLTSGDHDRFYTISITKEDTTWYTYATWGPIGSDGSTSTIYKGNSLEHAMQAGARMRNKRQSEGFIITSGGLKRR